MNVPSTPSVQPSSRGFGGLWAARDLTALGDGILLVALLAWSYHIHESATAVSILVTARLLPPFLLRFAAARLAGGRRALPVAVVAQLLTGAALLPLLTVESDDALPLVLIVALLAAIPSAFLRASHHALLGALLQGDRLTAAEKAFANTRLITRIAGPAAGTVLYSSTGLMGATIGALAALVVSLGILMIAGPRPPKEAPTLSPEASPAALQRGLVRALRYPPLRTVALLRLSVALVAGGLVVALVAFTVWGTFVTPEHVGLILAAQGVGMAAASAAYRPIKCRFPLSTVVATSLGLAASAGFAFSLSQYTGFALSFAAAMGFGFGLLIPSLDSLSAIHSPDKLHSSVRAGLCMATEAAALISAIAMGPLVDLLTPRMTIALVSVILWVPALYAFGAVADRESLPDQV